MKPDRRTALTAGLLFLVATTTNLAGSVLLRPLLDGPGYITRLSAHTTQVTVSALLYLVAAGACAGIAISLYPVLKGWGGGSALGSVVFRTMEALLYVVGVVAVLSAMDVGQQFAGVNTASSQALGDALLSLREQAIVAAVLAFCVGAFLYYVLFYRSRLIPRWLSVWGVVGVGLGIVASILALLSQSPVTDYAIVMIPLGVQEMVLAIWLIAKGFNPTEQPPVTSGRSDAPIERDSAMSHPAITVR
jgi:hypothetical protein